MIDHDDRRSFIDCAAARCTCNPCNLAVQKDEVEQGLRMIPSMLTVIAAAVLFYIGYVEVRGFEGAGYLFLSVFLLLFALVSYIVAKKPVQ